MKTFKPHLDDETIVIGINSAKELLFKPEYLTAELRSELESWEKLAETTGRCRERWRSVKYGR